MLVGLGKLLDKGGKDRGLGNTSGPGRTCTYTLEFGESFIARFWVQILILVHFISIWPELKIFPEGLSRESAQVC